MTNSEGSGLQRNSSNVSSHGVSAQLFKFCYIIRGLPGSGKSTVAAQLAGTTGVVLNLESNILKHSQTADNTSGQVAMEADSLVQI